MTNIHVGVLWMHLCAEVSSQQAIFVVQRAHLPSQLEVNIALAIFWQNVYRTFIPISVKNICLM